MRSDPSVESWICTTCTYRNTNSLHLCCAICGHARPDLESRLKSKTISRVLLDGTIERIKKEISESEELEADELLPALKKKLKELESRLKDYPSISELEACILHNEQEEKTAVEAGDYLRAAGAKAKVTDYRRRLKLEEEAQASYLAGDSGGPADPASSSQRPFNPEGGGGGGGESNRSSSSTYGPSSLSIGSQPGTHEEPSVELGESGRRSSFRRPITSRSITEDEMMAIHALDEELCRSRAPFRTTPQRSPSPPQMFRHGLRPDSRSSLRSRSVNASIYGCDANSRTQPPSVGSRDVSPLSDDTRLSFEIFVGQQDFKFHAGHFIAYAGYRDRLHGHNYAGQIRLIGKQRLDGKNLSRAHVREAVLAVCAEVHEHMIVPTISDVLTIEEESAEEDEIYGTGASGTVHITCEDGAHFTFPSLDCIMVPIVHSTTEELNIYLWARIVQSLGLTFLLDRGVHTLEVGLEDSPGQSSSFRRRLPTDERNPFDASGYVSNYLGRTLHQVSRSLPNCANLKPRRARKKREEEKPQELFLQEMNAIVDMINSGSLDTVGRPLKVEDLVKITNAHR
uniref:6-pyruvoyltetrahydropterin synthase n=1 Tax=Corethron hystrix TaxID=216773 RepID=A0A7S1BVH0_9STRA|mmetsp:Transcript_40260/g.94626  ORF Transcript_40260/g.94626 Transcript_40260/m.94626 type:complete len:570 (+) Transcript_40260:106-1815(+)|eukprot:CAMPEP_0113314564 /NCGR_PEP_ID=MMETSP0010_2-20120614/10572_1 /TAXON_ID=216773 ORGANISM="Corethron hystrix, Strain 308" /NCGR_SAMPLE_ID=MMETSP0010_2 /ASSEMBLY_ACC=CAM_ASM_000155 /LENGTH=569 /DNA_ID=CAMNT_0000170871 /DNA_START=383 /DNA_END=2092 /DNA_ORIENTATION=- /assembly_acc=CAM_ASM_000155